jgi:diaminopimelate epimerase
MNLRFTKMQGLGNDFVVCDGFRQAVSLSPEQCRRLADRRFGVGCDQILLVEPPRLAGTDFHYRIFNADGSEVEQCGNGARCFARFVREQGLTAKTEIPVGTAAGPIRLFIEADDAVRVNMGAPIFTPARIPFLAPAEWAASACPGSVSAGVHAEIAKPLTNLTSAEPEVATSNAAALPEADAYDLEVDGEVLRIGAVSMGNPHAVLRVDDLDRAPVDRLGPRIERHPRFPRRVNVGFMQVLAPDRIRLRVFERGAGETLACGTGACAAVAVGRRLGLLAERVQVSLPGGDLHIRWAGGDQPVWMTGPAVTVFTGEIPL